MGSGPYDIIVSKTEDGVIYEVRACGFRYLAEPLRSAPFVLMLISIVFAIPVTSLYVKSNGKTLSFIIPFTLIWTAGFIITFGYAVVRSKAAGFVRLCNRRVEIVENSPLRRRNCEVSDLNVIDVFVGGIGRGPKGIVFRFADRAPVVAFAGRGLIELKWLASEIKSHIAERHA